MSSWTPLGQMLADYHEGDTAAEADIIWEDGKRVCLPGSVFFREPEDFPEAESAAVDRCRGRVLDIGAGAGCHALALQELGLDVCALDVCPQAVEVMRSRGVRDPRLGDVFDVVPSGGSRGGDSVEGRYDTLLLLMNGIGVVGDLAGLDCFLALAHQLLAPSGQVLLDSSDIRMNDDVDELHRMVQRLRAGRYRGETCQQIEYRGCRGAVLGWLYLDTDTLNDHAGQNGWYRQVVYEGPNGTFTARLVRR